MKYMRYGIPVLFTLLSVGLCVSLTAKEDNKIDYDKHVVPLLKEHCYKCHGEKKQKGSLRVDIPKEIVNGGGNGAIVIPGNPDKSTLYSLTVLHPDDEDIMPAKGDPLKKEQADILRLWIEQGAKFNDGTTWEKAKTESTRDNSVTVLDLLSQKVSKPPSAVLKQLIDVGVKRIYVIMRHL